MKEQIKKCIYIIPSLFTCGNMVFGTLSMFSSIRGNFLFAAWLLIFAMICDILDGRIARITNTTSEFGSQLDSFSDLVSFGMAPAMMMYMCTLRDMGRSGAAIAVLFVLCSGLRLAKFNVKASKPHAVSNCFDGLPTPPAAGIITSFVLSYELVGSANTIPFLIDNIQFFFHVMPIVMVGLSVLMISNVPYPSFKKMNISKPKAICLLIIIIAAILLVIFYPQNTLFIIFSIYVLSGFFIYAFRIYQKIFHKRVNEESVLH
jgi:CDP-diacylglycerol--serine O-phosphatidyltransferase